MILFMGKTTEVPACWLCNGGKHSKQLHLAVMSLLAVGVEGGVGDREWVGVAGYLGYSM